MKEAKVHKSRILAVCPGSRYLGVAVFEGARLLEWGVRGIRSTDWNVRSTRCSAVIGSLIERYRPAILVLKKLEPRRSSVPLNRLTSGIKHLGLRRGLRVFTLRTPVVARLFVTDRRPSKRALAEELAVEHPILERELKAECTARRAYHVRMFEAVALGMAIRRVLGRI